MPIGVPKVPFRIPGEEDSVWVDGYNFVLINRLHRERILFSGQQVDSEIANQLMGLMIYLTIEDDTKDVYLFINSHGGWVTPGIAMYDTMQFVQPDVHTICMGLAASMGSFVLGGKWIIYRSGFDRSSTLGKSRFHSRAVCNAQKMPVRVMIHQPSSSFYEEQTGEFVLEAEELLKLRETLTRVYVQRTGNLLWVVSEVMERDVFMSATDAQDHGIVDLVAVENTGDFT
ncbi:hypothetical protein C5167_048180 [Papaver somniferum]|uniref:ATP-dependent Clp protease proteolytic subunit n=1 Tax=Papaver somniferum TaxID=3469 RepID=A0A4Y7KLD7_PAPSO|nr:hypothetical protein C5167_048180 [Papaver somniferum]